MSELQQSLGRLANTADQLKQFSLSDGLAREDTTDIKQLLIGLQSEVSTSFSHLKLLRKELFALSPGQKEHGQAAELQQDSST